MLHEPLNLTGGHWYDINLGVVSEILPAVSDESQMFVLQIDFLMNRYYSGILWANDLRRSDTNHRTDTNDQR